VRRPAKPGRPLAAANYLARLRALWNGAEVSGGAGPQFQDSRVTLALPGLLLAPGDSARLALLLDVSPQAPTGSLELMLPAAGLGASDANTGRGVSLRPSGGLELPLLSGVAQLESPARLLSVGLDSRMSAALTADGSTAPAAVVTLVNSDSAAAGAILVDHLDVRAASRTGAPQNVGAAATRIEAWLDGALWARSADLSPDSVAARLAPAAALELRPARAAQVELRMVPRADARVAGVRLGLAQADVGVVQPGSALLTVTIQPRPGQAFPMWTEAGGLTPADLRGSYSNYPNPFAAGRQATTLVYHLPRAATVSLRILTARGETVAQVLDGSPRAAGLHQDERWDRRNGRGAVVYNGVYVAELTAVYGDGTRERVVRKVAVVR